MSLGATALRAASRQKIVEDIPRPCRQPHRGVGGNVDKDDAMSSFNRLLALAPSYEPFEGMDMHLSSDGGVVVMHDSTVDRTTNGTGSVTAMTLAAFQALKMLNFPYVTGQTASSESPPIFQDVIDATIKYRGVFTPEAKTSDVVAPMIALVQAAGIVKSTIMGSFIIGDMAAMKAAGIKTYHCNSDGNHQTSAALLAQAANIDYIGFDYTAPSLDDTWLQPLLAAGMKAWPFTLTRRYDEQQVAARLAALSGGPFFIEALSSNEPVYCAGLWTPSLSYTPNTNYIEPGMIGANFGGLRPQPVGGWMQFASASTSGQWLLMGNMARSAAPSAVEVQCRVDTLPASTTRWFGLKLCATDDRALGTDATGSLTQGAGMGHYSAILRANGSLELYTISGAGASTQIGSSVATPALNVGDTPKLRFEISGSTVTLKRIDGGTTTGQVTGTNSLWRGPYFHIGKSFGTDGVCSFGTITVTP